MSPNVRCRRTSVQTQTHESYFRLFQHCSNASAPCSLFCSLARSTTVPEQL